MPRGSAATAVSGREDRRSSWAYAAGWRLVRALPRPVAWRGVPAGADRAARRRGAGAARLARNLRRVVGPDLPEAELDAAASATALRSYARYWMEAFRLPSLTPAAGRCAASGWSGAHLLGDAVAAGTGVRGGAAARRQLGRRRRLGVRRTAGRSPPSPNGSSRRRCTGGSSPSGSRSAWRSCRTGGRPAPPFDVLVDRLGAGPDRAAARRPRPVRARRRGRLLRRPYPDAGRPGAARDPYRRPAVRGVAVVRATGAAWPGATGRCRCRRPSSGALDVRVRALTQTDRRPLGRGHRPAPAGLAHAAADVAGPGARPGAARPSARTVVPVPQRA